MKTPSVAVLALAFATTLGAQQPAQTANPITAAFKARIGALSREIPQALDSIPESKFGFQAHARADVDRRRGAARRRRQLSLLQHLREHEGGHPGRRDEHAGLGEGHVAQGQARLATQGVVRILRESAGPGYRRGARRADHADVQRAQYEGGARRAWCSSTRSIWPTTTASSPITCGSTASSRRPRCHGRSGVAGNSGRTRLSDSNAAFPQSVRVHDEVPVLADRVVQGPALRIDARRRTRAPAPRGRRTAPTLRT